MMQYATYLRRLLEPMGAYDLSDGTQVRCELDTLGQALDAVNATIEKNLCNGIPLTADAKTLQGYFALLPLQPLDDDPDKLRAALLALLKLRGRSISLTVLNDLLALLTPGVSVVAEGTNQVHIAMDNVKSPQRAQAYAIAAFLLPCQAEIVI